MQGHIADKPDLVEEKNGVIIRWEVQPKTTEDNLVIQHIHMEAIGFTNDDDDNLKSHTIQYEICEHQHNSEDDLMQLTESNVEVEVSHHDDYAVATDTNKLKNNNIKSQVENVINYVYKPHKCSDCTAEFDSIIELKTHRKQHNGEKSFKCVVCSRYLSTKGNLTLFHEILILANFLIVRQPCLIKSLNFNGRNKQYLLK